MQARGLKLTPRFMRSKSKAVAPHAGAWIETQKHKERCQACGVAPHAGAWIETISRQCLQKYEESRLMQARGLKHRTYTIQSPQKKSRLMQARGLKHR